MREIKTHIVEGDSVNHQLELKATDNPIGGANHNYRVRYPTWEDDYLLEFQNGPIAEVGVNGLTNEVLLAVVIDRLEGFQKGRFACLNNSLAINHCVSALKHLQSRTKDRIARNVEGTLQE